MPALGKLKNRERRNEGIHIGNGGNGGYRDRGKFCVEQHVILVFCPEFFIRFGAYKLIFRKAIKPTFFLLFSAAALMVSPHTSAWAIESTIAQNSMRSVVSVLPKGDRKDVSAKEPQGSGVAVFDGRYILTALHVFNDAEDIRVRTFDGEIVKARVVGRDRATDLALLKIDHPLPVLKSGGDAKIGAEVCAIGNAFGLGLSLSCGTVSAIHRTDTGFNPIEDFVQTDTAVNPGASGGALIDEAGRLVGFLSAIFTKSADANIGVNFAVSEPLAMRAAEVLREHGKVQWPNAGAILRQVPKKGATGKLGGQIEKIISGSSAGKAKLEINDVIYHAGSRRIRHPRDFYSAVARLLPGENLEILFRRGEQEMTTSLTISK